jgi:4-diphosphocytidyl-2-C-methyl-D-erythritol kinase
MKSVLLLSPAKINLTLQVLRKREDDYHEIYTIFQKINLFDEIKITRGCRLFSLDFKGEEPIELEKNLVYKAYRKFKERFGIPEEVAIKVRKHIPIGAGLGGGSSNAGTVLKGLAYLYGISLEELYEIAVELGADVPFFLSSYHCAIGEGIGEKLTPFPNFSAWYLLIFPGFKINTGWAYKNLGLTKSKNPVYYSEQIPPWHTEYGLINDFKKLIFENFKIYEKYEKLLKEAGAIEVGLSGTGSVIFGVFEGNPPFFAYQILKELLKNEKIFIAKNLE